MNLCKYGTAHYIREFVFLTKNELVYRNTDFKSIRNLHFPIE